MCHFCKGSGSIKLITEKAEKINVCSTCYQKIKRREIKFVK